MAIPEMAIRLSTCRVCKELEKFESVSNRGRMLHYSVRHYAHEACGLEKWGEQFFDRLRPWQLRQFSYLIAKRFGLADSLGKRIEKLPPEPDYDAIKL